MVPGGIYGKNGSPDIIVCYKGRFIAIEGKAGDGKQSGWQRHRQKQIERAGGLYIVPYTLEYVQEFFSSLEPED